MRCTYCGSVVFSIPGFDPGHYCPLCGWSCVQRVPTTEEVASAKNELTTQWYRGNISGLFYDFLSTEDLQEAGATFLEKWSMAERTEENWRTPSPYWEVCPRCLHKYPVGVLPSEAICPECTRETHE